MPDPTDAEVVASLSASQEATESLRGSQEAAAASSGVLAGAMEKTAAAAQDLASGTRSAATETTGLLGGFADLGGSVREATRGLVDAAGGMEGIAEGAKIGAQTLAVFHGILGDAAGAFGTLGEASGLATARISDSWERVTAGAQAALKKLSEGREDIEKARKKIRDGQLDDSKLTEAQREGLDRLKTKLGEIEQKEEKLAAVREAMDAMSPFLKQIQGARDYEANLLKLSMATGEYTDLAAAQGGTTLDLARHAQETSQRLKGVSEATGVTVAKVTEFRTALGPVPGVLDSIGVASASTGKDMSYLETAMKVATGAGMEFGAAASSLRGIYENLGLQGAKQIEQFQAIGNVAKQAKMPLETVQGYFDELASSLRFLTQDMTGAMGLLGVFGDKLRANLGPAAIRDLASGMVRGLSEMDMSMRAFQSQMTGGPGGMLGALQIKEEMGTEGGMARSLERMQQAFRAETGHDIMTRKEAAESGRPDLAAAYVRQQELMQQMGLAGGEDQAAQLAEAMKDGVITADMMDGFATATDPLQETAAQGNEIMEQMNSGLDRIATAMDMLLISTTMGAEKGATVIGEVVGDLITGGKDKAAEAQEKLVQFFSSRGAEGKEAVEAAEKMIGAFVGSKDAATPASAKKGGKEEGTSIGDAVKSSLAELRALQDQVNKAVPGEAQETALDRVKEFFAGKSEKEMAALKSFAADSEDKVVKVLLDLTYMDEGMKKTAKQEVTSAKKDAMVKQTVAATP